MASKTMKTQKHVNSNLGEIRAEFGKGSNLPPKEERRAQIDGFYARRDAIDDLLEKSRKNPKDQAILESIEKKKRELDVYVKEHPAVASHLEWVEEKKRQAILTRQAVKIVNEKRNAEAMSYLKAQRDAKKKADAKVRLEEAVVRIQEIKANPTKRTDSKQRAFEAKMNEDKKKEKPIIVTKADYQTESGRLKNLVKELNATLGGYGDY